MYGYSFLMIKKVKKLSKKHVNYEQIHDFILSLYLTFSLSHGPQ
jgi:hypothetical protein